MLSVDEFFSIPSLRPYEGKVSCYMNESSFCIPYYDRVDVLRNFCLDIDSRGASHGGWQGDRLMTLFDTSNWDVNRVISWQTFCAEKPELAVMFADKVQQAVREGEIDRKYGSIYRSPT